jgi:hypothetical protein
MFASSVMGQGVLAPPPAEFAQTPSTLPMMGANFPATNQFQTIQTNTSTTLALPVEHWLDWGPLHFDPHPFYRFMYGNGIQAQPGQQSKTILNQFAPGLLMGWGNHWTLDFTPTLSFYSSRAFRDTTDYAVRLNGATTYQDWTFGLSQSYVSSSYPLVETASQNDTETYSTALNAAYQMSTKASLELAASQNFLFVSQALPGQQLSNSRIWSTMDWLNYQFWPKFGAAIGAGFGYDDVSVGSDLTFEQIQGRINWRVGEKLSLTANAGFQDTQFLNSSQPASLNPVFGLTLLYRLFEPTTLSLTAYETVSPSYFQNQITHATGFSAGISQRLLKKLSLNVSGGYSTTSYLGTATGVNTQSAYDLSFATVGLTAPFLKRGSASVFYYWSDNSSGQPGFGYTSRQVGFELGYRF